MYNRAWRAWKNRAKTFLKNSSQKSEWAIFVRGLCDSWSGCRSYPKHCKKCLVDFATLEEAKFVVFGDSPYD